MIRIKILLCGADRYLLRHETATDSHYKNYIRQTLSLELEKNA